MLNIYKKITVSRAAGSVLFLCLLILPSVIYAYNTGGDHQGKILLQVKGDGEAWYVYPEDGKRYYLGRPADAFAVMRFLSKGASHAFLESRETFPERLAGMILLDAESNGEAYYIHPTELTKHYLGRPADAFRVMRKFGTGTDDLSLLYIPVGYTAESAEIKEMNVPAPTQEVPFTSQAPFAEWSDPRQQDGCEESSALMAVKWGRGQTLNRQEALEEILAASAYLEDEYGEYRDTSARDTVDRIFKGYFGYGKATLKEEARVGDIIEELSRGNLVVAPMDGRKLGNPNFTPPGPSRHMLLIKGYDADRRVFITNDPGTRAGNGYEYDARVLFEAIRDYPTGYQEPIESVEKNVIVISR